ncbi:hypothetical protein, partial [Priestia megaterium]|uniref:hypothetical protein n=1 Tax=Priestia megaterium TaxID=1404 RepID=UPI001E5E1C98
RIAVETIKSIDPEKLETAENSQKALEKERIENFEKVSPSKPAYSKGPRTERKYKSRIRTDFVAVLSVCCRK